MAQKLLHIFRNTPLGRETLLQSIYFCQKMGVLPTIYIPEFTKFLMYFENEVVQVDLDPSYLNDPDTAATHAEQLLQKAKIKPELLTPKNYTASTLPDIPTSFEFMCCPRSISDLSSKIGLGYIGPRVRRIIQAARFPVLITSPVYKPWQNVAVFFGGSANAVNALRLGIRIAKATGMRLDIYTQVGGKKPSEYRAVVQEKGLEKPLESILGQWKFFEKGRFEDNLYEVPHDALVVLGAYGHGIIRDIMFGSMMEKIQSTISNNLLIAGPRYTIIG
ncbi:universal stress protein [uncultured Desulfosarcina sp.]|uniref:universal stress protein n=1 Tax=uncultured Desulfosarcina sp. TaxID=218289 RepID=UPI0029C64092|nr:universal stress protein [uncultured Desulfosarcina sp.]